MMEVSAEHTADLKFYRPTTEISNNITHTYNIILYIRRLQFPQIICFVKSFVFIDAQTMVLHKVNSGTTLAYKLRI